MLLRWWRRRDPLEKAWQEVTGRLGLEPSAEGHALVGELLDLPADASIGPVHRVRESGPAQVYLFWYRHSTHVRSPEPVYVTTCLLVSDSVLSPTSWRASRKLHSVIASLQASATGGEVIAVEGAEAFNRRVTLVAREGSRLLALLTPAVRGVLERMMTRTEPPPALTVGERRILLSVTGARPAFDAVEFLMTDALSLYAALDGA